MTVSPDVPSCNRPNCDCGDAQARATAAATRGACAIDDCAGGAVYRRQAVQAPDGTLVSIGVCEQHYGVRDVRPGPTAEPATREYRIVYQHPLNPAVSCTYFVSDDLGQQRETLAFLRSEGVGEAWIETCTRTPWERTDD